MPVHLFPPAPFSVLLRRVGGLALLLSLSACFTLPERPQVQVYQTERFQGDETFSRLFDAPPPATCEAARRTLLSQGYVLANVKPDLVQASKNFQPEGATHIQIAFTVTCLPEGKAGAVSTVYVNAIQDRYAVKKSANSASLGVSAIGSVSIPLSSTDDSLVKVGSETIPAGPFYDRFFALMSRYLSEQQALALPE